jgi:hypothetical protein
MKKIVLSLAVVVFVAAPAAAQERLDSSYKNEISLMYSMLHDYGENATAGFVVDFGRQVARIGGLATSVLGEVAFNRFGESSWDETYSHASAIVRFGTMKGARLRPFAQVLIGVQKSFDLNSFNLAPGAGVNLGLGRYTDLKVQVDVPFVRYPNRIYRQFRLSVGLGVPLGGR